MARILEDHVSQRQTLPVAQGLDFELDLRTLAERDDRPRPGCKFEVPAQKIGMNVRLDDPLDLEPAAGGLLQVDVDIALGVDYYGAPRSLVANQVRGVG